VRNELLINGVWALCNEESTLRMYPALNMNEQVFMDALNRLEEAIDRVNQGGDLVGDYPGVPSGVEGF
jgi:acetylornithine/succinyldiaminopimelate/putrescine aminotransferase